MRWERVKGRDGGLVPWTKEPKWIVRLLRAVLEKRFSSAQRAFGSENLTAELRLEQDLRV